MKIAIRKLFSLILAVVLISASAICESSDPVIATYKGGEVKVSEVAAQVESEINAMSSTLNYFRQMQGGEAYTPTEDDVAYVREYVVNAYINQQIVIQKMTEYGVSNLTEEEKAELQSSAQYTYAQYAYPYTVQFGYTLEQAAYALSMQGITIDTIYQNAYYSEINKRVMNALEIDKEISEENLKEKYDALIASAEQTYTNNPAAIENIANSASTVYFMPEGARYVKHIILIPEDEELMTRYESLISDLSAYETEYATITSEAYEPKYEAYIEQAIYDECVENIDLTKKAIEEIKNEVLASVQSEVDTVLKNVEAGKSFDELIETYSDDPVSKEEPIKTNGYLVHKDSKAWDEAFKDAAFSLEAAGDISSAAVGTLGVYIVKYESDPVFGAAALENVRSEVENTIYNERRSELFGTLTAQWIQEADIQLALDAWK